MLLNPRPLSLSGAPLLSGSGRNMETQNAGYTTGENGYDGYAANNGDNYNMDEQGTGYDQGYAPPGAGGGGGGGGGGAGGGAANNMVAAFNSMTSGSLFRSEEMALCQLFLQVRKVFRALCLCIM